MESFYWLIPAFFAVAVVYSMAGFGGGSSYLALLALSGMDYRLLPAVALLCNLAVASHSFYFFRRYFSLKLVLPFALTSIPLAYLGGRMDIGEKVFILLLGFSLLAAGWRLFFPKISPCRLSPSFLWVVGSGAGSVLGFLAGVVGIGGGIFLSPLLLLLGWADSKQAASAAAFFILVNSVSGLLGHAAGGLPGSDFMWPLLAAVVIGGQIGARWGSKSFSVFAVQRATAVLVLIAGVRLLLQF